MTLRGTFVDAGTGEAWAYLRVVAPSSGERVNVGPVRKGDEFLGGPFRMRVLEVCVSEGKTSVRVERSSTGAVMKVTQKGAVPGDTVGAMLDWPGYSS